MIILNNNNKSNFGGNEIFSVPPTKIRKNLLQYFCLSPLFLR